MSKDKIYGAFIALLFLVILIFYLWVVFLPITDAAFNLNLGLFKDEAMTYFFMMLPVFGGVALFSFIFIWIGYTMATTPPPEPIDLDSLDLDDDEEETKSE
jgi:hypothetical protein